VTFREFISTVLPLSFHLKISFAGKLFELANFFDDVKRLRLNCESTVFASDSEITFCNGPKVNVKKGKFMCSNFAQINIPFKVKCVGCKVGEEEVDRQTLIFARDGK